MPRKITKKTKKSKKGDVTQTVIVNVAKRGSSKPRAPSQQPSQAQILLSLLGQRQPLQTQQPLVQAQQPLLESLQKLQQLNNLLRPQPQPQQQPVPQPQPQQPIPQIVINVPKGEKGERGERGEKGEPFRFPESPIWSESEPLFDFPLIPDSRPRVVDLPDAPLVTPSQPAVSNAPVRLDDPHEDVPIPENLKQPVSAEEEEEQVEAYLSPYEIPPITDITREYLQQAPNTTEAKTNKVTLRQIKNAYGLVLSKEQMKTKGSMVDAMWTQIQERRRNPDMASSSPK